MQPTSVGVTQVNGLRPRQVIVMGGEEWHLRRDASDASTSFPHQKVNWINAGCEPLEGLQAHYCWVKGLIPPTPGTLERPVTVMYVGFHPSKIMMQPNAVSQADLDRMHVYVSDGGAFAQDFVNMFLGIGKSVPLEEQRETISPWPQTQAKAPETPVVVNEQVKPTATVAEVKPNDKQ